MEKIEKEVKEVQVLIEAFDHSRANITVCKDIYGRIYVCEMADGIKLNGWMLRYLVTLAKCDEEQKNKKDFSKEVKDDVFSAVRGWIEPQLRYYSERLAEFEKKKITRKKRK